MADHITEEEQIETIKRWWAENGRGIVTGVVLALAGYFGYQWWQTNERAKAEEASNLYQTFIEAVSANQGKPNNKQLTTANSLARQLQEDYSKRIYAAQAALRLAALAVEKNDLEAAAKQLQWALDNSSQDAFKFLAQRRLAIVLAARGQTKEALALLDGPVPSEFGALFAESRGDILLQQGDKSAARAAYARAKAQLLPEQASIGQLLDMKMSSIAEPAAESVQQQDLLEAKEQNEVTTQPQQERDAQ